ncbi:MAG: hypothetical protein Kow0090_14500 [Myxococcota bacterium]
MREFFGSTEAGAIRGGWFCPSPLSASGSPSIFGGKMQAPIAAVKKTLKKTDIALPFFTMLPITTDD